MRMCLYVYEGRRASRLHGCGGAVKGQEEHVPEACGKGDPGKKPERQDAVEPPEPLEQPVAFQLGEGRKEPRDDGPHGAPHLPGITLHIDSEPFHEESCDTHQAKKRQNQNLSKGSVSRRGCVFPDREQGKEDPQDEAGPGKIGDKGNQQVRRAREESFVPVVGQHQVAGHEEENHESIEDEQVPPTGVVFPGQGPVEQDVL